ncbi:uncharacterized protein TNCV_4064741 [Trichonephila clavipes]|nr:uncharacterized protein TNCV_4064741 [Trichonephila clavipes]
MEENKHVGEDRDVSQGKIAMGVWSQELVEKEEGKGVPIQYLYLTRYFFLHSLIGSPYCVDASFFEGFEMFDIYGIYLVINKLAFSIFHKEFEEILGKRYAKKSYNATDSDSDCETDSSSDDDQEDIKYILSRCTLLCPVPTRSNFVLVVAFLIRVVMMDIKILDCFHTLYICEYFLKVLYKRTFWKIFQSEEDFNKLKCFCDGFCKLKYSSLTELRNTPFGENWINLVQSCMEVSDVSFSLENSEKEIFDIGWSMRNNLEFNPEISEEIEKAFFSGLNGACISVRKRISAEISNGSSFKRKLNFLIVPKITGCVPTQPLDLTKIKLPQNIRYADAEFNIPKRIDILLGEAIGIKAESSCDPDDKAMQHFKSSVRFNSGRYEVGFPWKSHTQELNDNFSVAEKRVKSLTRRFIRDPTLYIQYSEILKEYESQGIVERVLETEKPTDRAVFYLPHQAVFRQESLTTKMRIVFDASSHEDGQPSLNDCIWSGENLNPNIFHLIISFRLNTIAITADIERAFLQISLRDEDRDAVRFLFPDMRSNQTDPYKFQVYRFKRVMFGVNVSPFLLSATIKHHIENYREQYPAATEMLDTCLYVDDVISGADDISQALKVSKDAETIMKNASMKLRKWNSNDQTLMRTWEKEGLETHPRHPDDSSKIPSSKVLGIPWDVVHDYFTIDVKGLLQLDTSKPITKRIVLQSAGKIYDPVGLLSPYTIRLKCLLQELWLRKLSWDDELPPDIHAVWSQWWLELPFLSELKIPRKILDSSGDSSEVQIHTFSDASQKAYGAAAFLRVKHKDRVSVDLVTSKSRVAPLKRLSLPRLELMGALLAARLAKDQENPRSEVFNQSLFLDGLSGHLTLDQRSKP